MKADRISTRAVGNTSSAVYEAAAPPGDDPLALKKMLMEQVREHCLIAIIHYEYIHPTILQCACSTVFPIAQLPADAHMVLLIGMV